MIELRRPTWSNDRHAKQWTESLTNHAYPVIGRKRVDEVTSADVLAVLNPIWTAKAETASRVYQRLCVVFDWSIAAGHRQDNPASAVARALTRRPRVKRHHPALDYSEVPAARKSVHESTADPTTRLAFEFIVLTAARAGEVRGATWSEMDLDSATWTVPADRMKTRREHQVPLSDQAMSILAEARKLGAAGYVLPSKRGGGKPISNMAFEMPLRRLDFPATPHGFRSSFKDWSIEAKFDWPLSETALAHNLGNSMEHAYARTDLFDLRRPMMEAWGSYVCG